MIIYGRLLSASLIFSALAAIDPVSAQTLRMGGTGAATEMLRQIAPVFKAETGIALDAVPSLGTSGGNSAVADGVLGLSVAGRDLKEKETAKGLRVVATFRSPFGLATSRLGPDALQSNKIAELYRADKPLWPDGTPILIFLRPVDESDNLVLGELFPAMADAIQHLRKRRDLTIAATDQDNAEIAEKTKGSLIGATLTQIMTEKRNLRFVSIDNVALTMENYENGSYPFEKTFYLVAPAEIGPEAASFLAFVATPAGTSLLRQTGILAGAK